MKLRRERVVHFLGKFFVVNNCLWFSFIPLFTKGRFYFVYDKKNNNRNFQLVTHFVQNICLHGFIQYQHLFGGNLHLIPFLPELPKELGRLCINAACSTLHYRSDNMHHLRLQPVIDMFCKFLPCVIKIG